MRKRYQTTAQWAISQIAAQWRRRYNRGGVFWFWTRTWLTVVAWLLLTLVAVYVIVAYVQPRGGFA